MEVYNPPILTGHTVFLRLPTEADVLGGRWHTWYNDPETTAYTSHGVFPITLAAELEYVRSSLDRRDRISLALCAKETGHLIGNCSLFNIDLLHRKAEIAITIGEAEYRKQTCGLEAVGLMTEHAICRLNLNRIHGGVDERLDRWLRMMGLFGYREEGRMREDIQRDGRSYDVIRFGLLAREFLRLRDDRGGRILFATYAELAAAVGHLARSAASKR